MSAPTENEAVSTDADREARELGGTRVYIGNLPFTATEAEVRDVAGKAGGEILGIIMPTKGGPRGVRRPAGFAFVHFKDEAQAQAAVEHLTDAGLGDRKLTAQIGRSKEEQAARREKHVEAREAAKAARAEQVKEEPNGEAEEEKKRERAPRKRTPRRRRPADGEEGEEAAEAGAEANGTDGPGATSDGKVPRRRSDRARAPREPKGRIDGEEGAESKPRPPRQRLTLTDDKTPDAVFVSNLPFNVDDDALATIFTNLSIRVKSAKIIRGMRRGRGGRPYRASRGFGIVELEDGTQQQEAVDKVTGSLIGDRTITAKVANQMKPIDSEDAEAVEAEV